MIKHDWQDRYAPKTTTVYGGFGGTAYVCAACGAHGWLIEDITPEHKKAWEDKHACGQRAAPEEAEAGTGRMPQLSECTIDVREENET